MQAQPRLTTKDLDDAQVGYEKKYADAQVLFPNAIFCLLVFSHAGNLIFGGFALNVIRSFLVLSLKMVCNSTGFCPKWLFRRCVWYFTHMKFLKSLVYPTHAICIL